MIKPVTNYNLIIARNHSNLNESYQSKKFKSRNSFLVSSVCQVISPLKSWIQPAIPAFSELHKNDMSETIKRPTIFTKNTFCFTRHSHVTKFVETSYFCHALIASFFQKSGTPSVILSPNGRFHTFSSIKYHVMVCVIYDLSVYLLYTQPSLGYITVTLCVLCRFIEPLHNS